MAGWSRLPLCYEGIVAAQALFEWDHARRRCTSAAEAAGRADSAGVNASKGSG